MAKIITVTNDSRRMRNRRNITIISIVSAVILPVFVLGIAFGIIHFGPLLLAGNPENNMRNVNIYLSPADNYRDITIEIPVGESFTKTFGDVTKIMAERKLTLPYIAPNLAFSGWYTDHARTVRYDGSPILTNIDLFAGWVVI